MNAPDQNSQESPVVVETTGCDSETTNPMPLDEPLFPPKETGEAVDPTAVLTALRLFHFGRFHRGRFHGSRFQGDRLPGTDPGHGEGVKEGDVQAIGSDLLPALLAPFRDPSRVRTTFPLFLDPPGMGPEGRVFTPLADLLRDLVQSFAPGEEQARILKDNLVRIERHVRDQLSGAIAPVEAGPIITHAGEAMVRELRLSAENAERLEADLSALTTAIPTGARLLAFSEAAPLVLHLVISQASMIRRLAAFADQARALCRKLQALLQVERSKTPDSRDPDALQASMGLAAGRFMDPAKLAALEARAGAPGTQTMAPERRERIEGVLATLLDFTAAKDRPLLGIVHAPALGGVVAASLGASQAASAKAGGNRVQVASEENPCEAAARLFDEQAAFMAEIFKAARIARLEIADGFDAERHGPWLEEFGWEAFSHDELLLVPPVVAFTPDGPLAARQMVSLSRLLLSGRPVKTMVMSRPASNPAFDAQAGDPAAGFRLELGHLGLSHREVLVHQSSPACPEHLARGLARAAGATRPSLHVIASIHTLSGEGSVLGPWFQASAAWESRAHPLFLYDPEAGETWARRFDFSDNPQAELDWPLYTIACRNAEGGSEDLEIPFTFADFALLEPALREHFCIAPPGCADDDLLCLGDYLRLDAETAARKVPYIWAVDAEQHLHRVVVSRRLVFACRDRTDTWHNLCELAGIHNEYVEQAMARVQAELQAETEARIAEIEARHAEEIEQVRREAAGEAMQRLAATLLETDFTALMPVSGTGGSKGVSATTGQTPATTGTTAGQAASEESATASGEATDSGETTEDDAEAEVSFDEPWIDSTLCSTCNDCINLNSQLFTYNENKQATLGDPHAGTFAQLVKAAEKCPSHCIHPGKPLDPNEPGLDELIKRAAKYN